MKKSTKNIICIVILIMMIALTYLTMNYAKNNIKINNNQIMNGDMTPPDKPDESNMPNGSDTNTPGEKPSEDNINDNNQNETDSKPSESMPPSMPNDMNKSSDTKKSSLLTWPYYLLFISESVIISGLVLYLVMSNFNTKNIKDTFYAKDKIIIYVLSIIIFTTILTYIDTKVVNKYFITSNNGVNNIENRPSNNENTTYSSVTEIKEDKKIDEGTYESSTKDENAILVSGEVDVTLSNVTVNKTGDSDGGDNTSFYGTNSAIIAKDKANLTIEGANINTDATGANGVFSYGGSATTNNTSSDNTTVTINNSTITTSKDNSGGIMTTGGGIMYANNLTITTNGTSSAAIRSDRGGGTVVVDKGTYTTTGKGSPSIYSTADITVRNATLISKASEGIVIEGKNKVTIENVDLTDTNNELNGNSTTYKNIFLYQSMSGDAANGSSIFTAKNSKIITNVGDTFYITNTTAIINLENNTITNNDASGNFLRAKSDSWGNSNSNGGDVTLNLTNQTVVGNIDIDNISTLIMNMNNSYYEGMINNDNTAKSISLTIDKDSKIKLTKDSYVTSFTNEDETNSNIDFNGYKLYVNGKAIN